MILEYKSRGHVENYDIKAIYSDAHILRLSFLDRLREQGLVQISIYDLSFLLLKNIGLYQWIEGFIERSFGYINIFVKKISVDLHISPSTELARI